MYAQAAQSKREHDRARMDALRGMSPFERRVLLALMAMERKPVEVPKPHRGPPVVYVYGVEQ